jgi:hypothetical protein
MKHTHTHTHTVPARFEVLALEIFHRGPDALERLHLLLQFALVKP